MARSLSSAATTSIHSQETGEVWLVLLTITHSTLPTPIRVVNNNEDITSRGNIYQAFPFEIILPSQDPDSIPKASLKFDNVDRTAISIIRGVEFPPAVTIEVILASQPDTIEVSFPNLTLRNVKYDAEAIEGELLFENLFSEPVTLTMTPSRFPGLF